MKGKGRALPFNANYSLNKQISEVMNIENTQSQMRKGVLEFCILSVIQRGEVYPSDIIEDMKKANLNLLEGTLYPLLTRLKNADFLTYRWVESSSGPPRKYFSLTEKGAAFYKELQFTWNDMVNSVTTIIEKNGVPNATVSGETITVHPSTDNQL